ncbi:MAG: hypothetical protein QOH26_567 [Actinomycetota bacterium]|nr:hypothetical protein [Actinomycetota bacterium]
MSKCAKPGCAGSATSVLSYDYSQRVAVLDDPGLGPISPHVYALCSPCAERLQPPVGWTLEDERSEPPLFLDDARHGASVASVEGNERAEEAVSAARQLFFGQSA